MEVACDSNAFAQICISAIWLQVMFYLITISTSMCPSFIRAIANLKCRILHLIKMQGLFGSVYTSGLLVWIIFPHLIVTFCSHCSVCSCNSEGAKAENNLQEHRVFRSCNCVQNMMQFCKFNTTFLFPETINESDTKVHFTDLQTLQIKSKNTGCSTSLHRWNGSHFGCNIQQDGISAGYSTNSKSLSLFKAKSN